MACVWRLCGMCVMCFCVTCVLVCDVFLCDMCVCVCGICVVSACVTKHTQRAVNPHIFCLNFGYICSMQYIIFLPRFVSAAQNDRVHLSYHRGLSHSNISVHSCIIGSIKLYNLLFTYHVNLVNTLGLFDTFFQVLSCPNMNSDFVILTRFHKFGGSLTDANAFNFGQAKASQCVATRLSSTLRKAYHLTERSQSTMDIL